jgi:glutamate N-acetyltransferase/amino-acid N-acetyltransferase
MTVNLKAPLKKNILNVPGFRFLTFGAKIKLKNLKNDIVIVELGKKSKTAAVFTKNKFCAAPVLLAKDNLKLNDPQLLIINSGNANAGTGQKGIEDAKKINTELGKYFSLDPSLILPFSTGVILQNLPVERIKDSFKNNLTKIKYGSNWIDAAKSIMTTDTVPKAVSIKFNLGKNEITCTGIAKGSGMIHPNMATMLGFIFIDVKISKTLLKDLVRYVADRSFNLISVDGDTSTNDSFVISTSNDADNPVITKKDKMYIKLRNNVLEIAKDLAEKIVRDGEGATKFVEIEVKNAKNLSESKIIGKAIANSPLVKTAFFASDPNLGRILSAIGNVSMADLDISLIDLYLNNNIVVKNGMLSKRYSEKKAIEAMKSKEFKLSIDLKRGKEVATILTTDLSYEYVKINAEYRT